VRRTVSEGQQEVRHDGKLHPMNQTITVAGIDVGGTKKGFHLAILRGRELVDVFSSPDALQIHARCLSFDVRAIGIDAPSQWALDHAGRAAEKALARERISCFSTPTEEKALASTSGFYEWMFNGARVYAACAQTHPVLKEAMFSGAPVSFETFPHAITCAYLKEEASAKKKNTQRRKLLEDEGIDTSKLKSIDDIDAALCALAAQGLIAGETRAFGDAAGGYIFVPNARHDIRPPLPNAQARPYP
jgi:predicted nuclease with RNAse H fold